MPINGVRRGHASMSPHVCSSHGRKLTQDLPLRLEPIVQSRPFSVTSQGMEFVCPFLDPLVEIIAWINRMDGDSLDLDRCSPRLFSRSGLLPMFGALAARA